MKLLSFEPMGEKFAFAVQSGNRIEKIILKEKHNWPVIFGQEIGLVEKWLFSNYKDLIDLAFLAK